MSFEFTLLGFKHYRKERVADSSSSPEEKMTKRKSISKKVKVQRSKFTKAVQYCHKTTKGRKTFGSCMKKKLKKGGKD